METFDNTVDKSQPDMVVTGSGGGGGTV